MLYYLNKVILILLLIFLYGCTPKSKPVISKDANLSNIKCIALNTIGVSKPFVSTLNSLYHFDNSCNLKLYITYKKDIVCNSPYNPNRKNVSEFPKSFLNLELKNGFKTEYSYYIDLYSNVDKNDVKSAFLKLKKDLNL